MIKHLAVLLCLSACSMTQQTPERGLLAESYQLENKLRIHFSGHRQGDISTLSREALNMAKKLKRANMTAEANRFESYADVLIYGNQTLEESMQDVFNLVNRQGPSAKKNCSCSCCRH